MESLLRMCLTNQQQMKLELSFTASQGHIAADEIILLAVGTERPSGTLKPCPHSCHQHRGPWQVLVHSGLWGYGRDQGDGSYSPTPVWKWIQIHSLECIWLVSPQAAQLWVRAVISAAFTPSPSKQVCREHRMFHSGFPPNLNLASGDGTSWRKGPIWLPGHGGFAWLPVRKTVIWSFMKWMCVLCKPLQNVKDCCDQAGSWYGQTISL